MMRSGVSALAMSFGCGFNDAPPLSEIIPHGSFDQIPRNDKRLLRNPNRKRVAADMVMALDSITGKLSSFFVADQMNALVARRFPRFGDDFLR